MPNNYKWEMISSSAATICKYSIPEKSLPYPPSRNRKKEESKPNKTQNPSWPSSSAILSYKRKTCAC